MGPLNVATALKKNMHRWVINITLMASRKARAW